MSSRDQIERGERFAFGKNWAKFLGALDEQRIITAEESLKAMLGRDTLCGASFLDIGSGSGLFSLAARRLGARVTSFDYDPDSVACTNELKRRYFDSDPAWTILEGSVLDSGFVEDLPCSDIVYSWGVLHHTGHMWLAIERAISRLAKDGVLFIAIYNDQGIKSHVWWLLKYVYNSLPRPLNTLYGYSFGLCVYALNIVKYTLKLQPMSAIRPLMNYKQKRGMSVMRDLIDWMGGFPFEFARYEVLSDYLQARGFNLTKGIQASGLGCHEMVFRRGAAPRRCAD